MNLEPIETKCRICQMPMTIEIDSEQSEFSHAHLALMATCDACYEARYPKGTIGSSPKKESAPPESQEVRRPYLDD